MFSFGRNLIGKREANVYSVIELCCAVIACCAPSINLFWKQITEQRTSTSTSNSKRKTSMRTWLGRTINFSTFRNRNRCGKSGNSSNSDDSANWSSDPKKPVESIFITHDFVMSSSGGSLLAKNETYAPRGSPYTQDVEAQMSSPSAPAPSSTRDIRNEKAALGGSRSADLKW